MFFLAPPVLALMGTTIGLNAFLSGIGRRGEVAEGRFTSSGPQDWWKETTTTLADYFNNGVITTLRTAQNAAPGPNGELTFSSHIADAGKSSEIATTQARGEQNWRKIGDRIALLRDTAISYIAPTAVALTGSVALPLISLVPGGQILGIAALTLATGATFATAKVNEMTTRFVMAERERLADPLTSLTAIANSKLAPLLSLAYNNVPELQTAMRTLGVDEIKESIQPGRIPTATYEGFRFGLRESFGPIGETLANLLPQIGDSTPVYG
jgi:hypothetical protein